ncbi:MAG: RNA polymerase sigma factor [Patescibacteria group bacterium]
MGFSQDNFIAHYEKYKDKIYVYFLYRVGFNRETAEDLTSEVFLKALKSFSTFDQNRSFQSWIYAIAHNHLVNHYRVANREVELTENVSITQSDHKKIELGYELELILKEINKMEANDRDILLLRFVDQLDNSEIAELLGKEEGAVRTKISRSLAKLREKLDGHG